MEAATNFRITSLHRQLLETNKRVQDSLDLVPASFDLKYETMTEENQLVLSVQRIKESMSLMED